MRRRRDHAAEAKPMYLCIIDAVVGEAKDFRPGAHHAMVVLIGAASAAEAEREAAEQADRAGWLHIEVKHVEELTEQSDVMENAVLHEAVEVARLRGHCIAVDVEEIPLDS